MLLYCIFQACCRIQYHIILEGGDISAICFAHKVKLLRQLYLKLRIYKAMYSTTLEWLIKTSLSSWSSYRAKYRWSGTAPTHNNQH